MKGKYHSKGKYHKGKGKYHKGKGKGRGRGKHLSTKYVMRRGGIKL